MTIAQDKITPELDENRDSFDHYDPIQQAVHLRPRNKENILRHF